jgi:hypothetical protein
MLSTSFGPKFVLLLFIFQYECDRSAAWHAFADQEAVPTVPGTSLNSNIQLPNLELATACDVSATSFQKLSMVWKQQFTESRYVIVYLADHAFLVDMFREQQRNVFSAVRYFVGICYS